MGWRVLALPLAACGGRAARSCCGFPNTGGTEMETP